MLVCSSPQLIAAYHVLHRLSEPRHPPYALNCFKKIEILESFTSYYVTRYYNFIPNMSKNFIKLKAQSVKLKANCLIIDDVMIMNH